jgi:hypothetical protein
MRVPELAAGYKEILRQAAGVVTRPGLVPRFLGMGLAREQILIGPPAAVPPGFRPDATALSPADVARLAYPPAGPAAHFDPALPTIGMYGKPGEAKGTFDFIAAAGAVRDGEPFNLLLMCGGSLLDPLRAAVAAAGLTDRTWLLPFLPHWRVPAFIRRCTAVAFLERDFPVAIHRPVVPREVLACGTCLVLSGEIHRKQHGLDGLADGDTMLLVPNPKDHASLATTLRRIVAAPGEAGEIGARGRRLVDGDESYPALVDHWEALLRDRVPAPPEPAETRLAWARTALGGSFDAALGTFPRPYEDSLRYGEGFSRYLSDSPDPVIRDVARYQLARGWATRDEPSLRVPVAGDVVARSPSPDEVAHRYPVRCAPIRLERFDHDVTPLFCETGEEPVRAVAGGIVIGFARLPNLSPAEFRLNDATAALLARCDGTDDTATVLAGVTDGRAEHVTQAHAVLRHFYTTGVLAFTDRPEPSCPLYPAESKPGRQPQTNGGR